MDRLFVLTLAFIVSFTAETVKKMLMSTLVRTIYWYFVSPKESSFKSRGGECLWKDIKLPLY